MLADAFPMPHQNSPSFLSDRLASVSSSEELHLASPSFKGDFGSHMRHLVGAGADFLVLAGTADTKSPIQWGNLGIPPGRGKVLLNDRRKIDDLIAKSSKIKFLPSGSVLIRNPSRYRIISDTSHCKSLIVVTRPLSEPFQEKKWYLSLLDMRDEGVAIGNPQQTLLAKQTGIVAEHYRNCAKLIADSLSEASKPSDILPSLVIAKSIISFAKSIRAELSSLWRKRLRELIKVERSEHNYLFRRPLTAIFSEKAQILVTEEFGEEIVGRGNEFDSALLDFSKQVHETYQALRRTRPYRRSATEKRFWQLLCRCIDVELYELSIPIRVQQVGKIIRASNASLIVKWENGTRQQIACDKVPDSFKSLRRGTRFEAIISYDSNNHRLKAIHSYTKLEAIKFSSKDATRMWSRMKVLGEPTST